MNNTTTRRALARRLARLIEEAGGQADFCRKVWPADRDPVGGNKSKVSKWASGGSGMSAEEAERVARAFGRRPAFLLFGEMPEMDGATRSRADLAQELANHIGAALEHRCPADVTLLGATAEWAVDGEAALKRAIDMGVADAERQLVRLRQLARDYAFGQGMREEIAHLEQLALQEPTGSPTRKALFLALTRLRELSQRIEEAASTALGQPPAPSAVSFAWRDAASTLAEDAHANVLTAHHSSPKGIVMRRQRERAGKAPKTIKRSK